MKLTVQQEHLSRALDVVGRTMPTKSTLPILGNVLLDARDGELAVAANNLETAVAHRLSVAVDEEGACTLPARLLADYVDLLGSDEPVRLELNRQSCKVHLACGRFEANIAGIPAEDFPPLPQVIGNADVSLPAAVLKQAIGACAFAAAPDDSRPVLAGLLLRLGNGRLTLAAADGFRLAICELEAPDGAAGELELIVPARALGALARLLPSGEGQQVTLSRTPDGNQALFAFGRTQLASRLIKGQFPDYQRVLPTQAATTATMATADLLRATRAAAVFARDNSDIVRLEIGAPPEVTGADTVAQVVVRSTSAKLGDNQGQLDAIVQGEPQAVAFNGRYLRDALVQVDAASVALELTSPSAPGVLRPAPMAPTGPTYVIMPMAVPSAA